MAPDGKKIVCSRCNTFSEKVPQNSLESFLQELNERGWVVEGVVEGAFELVCPLCVTTEDIDGSKLSRDFKFHPATVRYIEAVFEQSWNRIGPIRTEKLNGYQVYEMLMTLLDQLKQNPRMDIYEELELFERLENDVVNSVRWKDDGSEPEKSVEKSVPPPTPKKRNDDCSTPGEGLSIQSPILR